MENQFRQNLKSLEIDNKGFFNTIKIEMFGDKERGDAFLEALTNHYSVKTLSLSFSAFDMSGLSAIFEIEATLMTPMSASILKVEIESLYNITFSVTPTATDEQTASVN